MYTIRWWDHGTNTTEWIELDTHKEAEGALKMLQGQKQPRIVVIKGENVARFTRNEEGSYDRFLTTASLGEPFVEKTTCPHCYDHMDGTCILCGALQGETENGVFLVAC